MKRVAAGQTEAVVATVTWPASNFYWAVLEAPGYRRAGPLPPGLLALLADEIPQPVEEVFAVGIPIGAGRVLACAAPREKLAGVDPAARSLLPSEPPPGIELPSNHILNMLVGEFEPVPIRRERWRRHLNRAAVVTLLVTLAAVGLARRASHWKATERETRAAQAQLAADLFGHGVPAEHALMSLDADLERLRGLAASRPKPPNDAAVQLASLLKAWPGDTPSKPQSVAVNEAGINVSVSVEGDSAPFLAAFKPPEGWTLDQPRLNNAGSVTRMTLRLRPEPSGSDRGAAP